MRAVHTLLPPATRASPRGRRACCKWQTHFLMRLPCPLFFRLFSTKRMGDGLHGFGEILLGQMWGMKKKTGVWHILGLQSARKRCRLCHRNARDAFQTYEL